MPYQDEPLVDEDEYCTAEVVEIGAMSAKKRH